jgi:hypothetical protein
MRLGQRVPEEVKKKIRRGNIRAWARGLRHGHRHSQETRAKIAAGLRRYMEAKGAGEPAVRAMRARAKAEKARAAATALREAAAQKEAEAAALLAREGGNDAATAG